MLNAWRRSSALQNAQKRYLSACAPMRSRACTYGTNVKCVRSPCTTDSRRPKDTAGAPVEQRTSRKMQVVPYAHNPTRYHSRICRCLFDSQIPLAWQYYQDENDSTENGVNNKEGWVGLKKICGRYDAIWYEMRENADELLSNDKRKATGPGQGTFKPRRRPHPKASHQQAYLWIAMSSCLNAHQQKALTRVLHV
jgi:hypothetical protein